MPNRFSGTANQTHAVPRQSGTALLLAMLAVALVATLTSSAAWLQWRQSEVETAERARVQSAWLLAGGLDWARHILREDGLTGVVDHLGEPWAVPLQESRLSTFLALDPNNNADPTLGAEIFLSGQITDLQSRLNVFNLIEGGQVSILSV